MNWVDLTLLTVLALFGLRGYFRGVFREVFSLAGLIAGFMAAVDYREPLGALLTAYWHVSPLIVKGTVFVVIFFVVYFLCNWVGLLLHRAERLLFLQTFNRVGGIAVGVGKGATAMALIIFFLSSASWLPYSTRAKLDDAYLTLPLSQLAEGIVRIGKDKLFPKMRGQEQASAGLLLPS